MARLPSVNQNRRILQADLQGVPADVAANPFMQIGSALGYIGENVKKSELDTAETQGQNAVYRDQDGNLQVTLRDNTTDTARAYDHAAKVGYTARLMSDIQAQGQQQADAAKGDPAVFNTGWNTYSKNLLKGVPEELQGSISGALQQEGARYSLGVSEVKRKRDIAVAEDDAKAGVESLSNDLAVLARAGGTNTPDYQAKRGQLASLYQQMVANPDFSMSQSQADIELKHIESRNMAEAMAGTVTKTFQDKGAAEAQKQADGILTDTSLDLSPSERRQYSGIMNETINGLRAQQKVDLIPTQQRAKTMKDSLAIGRGIDDPAIDDTIASLSKGGDPVGALDLRDARRRAIAARDLRTATPEQRLQRAEVLAGNPSALQSSSAVDTSTPTGQLFNGIEQKNGLPPGYLARTMHIESSGRNLGPNKAGAEGYFQFIPSTAARLGVNPRDLNSSADGAGRLAAESARYLRTGLGRDPTGAELYLAHQQGAGGATKLINNPDANAASLVGTKAIIQNGGREDMTARQFVQMWADKYNGSPTVANAQTGNSAYGSSYTVDPAIVKDYQDGVTADAKAMWPDIKRNIEQGYTPDAQSFSIFTRQLAVVNDPQFKQEVSSFMGTQVGARAVADLPAEQRSAAISAMQADAAAGSSIAAQNIAQAAETYERQIAEGLKSDPIGLASQRGWAPAVPALDLSTGSAAIGTALSARQKSVDLLRARGEVGNISALRPEDQTVLSSFIQTAKPSDQAALLGTMAQSLSPETFKATMADLAQKADTNALATAGALYSQNQGVAESLIRGRALLTQNPNFGPKKTDANNESIDQILPPTSFGAGLEGGRQQLLEAAKARYADLSNFAGDTSGELNTTRMTQAINDVTGGLLTFNGDTVIAPRYGMIQDQFDQTMKNLPAHQIAGAISTDGTPITARDIWRQGRLKAIGDGQYLIDFSVSGNTPSYAQTTRAVGVADALYGDSRLTRIAPLVLDLRKK